MFEEFEVEVGVERNQINFGKSSRARVVVVAQPVLRFRRKDWALQPMTARPNPRVTLRKRVH